MSLDNQISKLEKEIETLRRKIEPLDDRLMKAIEELEPLKEERDKLILKKRSKKDKNKVDIDLILTPNTGSMAMYHEQQAQIERLGISQSLYFRETNQNCFCVALTKGDKDKTEEVYKGLCFVLPHLKPLKEHMGDDNVIVISITEKSLSQYCSYYLHLSRNNPNSSCKIVTSSYSQEGGKFRNLREALNYIEKNLYYKRKD